ncbi:MAG: thioesterase family protein [Dehalococcoidales bacterium]|nr:thioesterase family protein [Dehalococcoidales bacterium]
MAEIKLGLKGEATVEVTEANSTRHLGDVRVFTTPSLVALLETACLTTVRPYLPEGQATVGVGINIRHLAATPVGMTVRATCELTEVKGRVLAFRVEAHDAREKIAEGTHWRAIVNIEEVVARIRAKVQS